MWYFTATTNFCYLFQASAVNNSPSTTSGISTATAATTDTIINTDTTTNITTSPPALVCAAIAAV